MSERRADQLVEAGVWLQATGDAEGAARLFEQALKLDPNNSRARQLLKAREERLMRQAATSPSRLAPPPRAESPPAPLPMPAAVAVQTPPPPPPAPVDAGGAGWDEPSNAWSPRELTPYASSAWDTASNPGFMIHTPPSSGGHDPLDLISEGTPAPASPQEKRIEVEELETLVRGARDLLELDDHTGAMDLLNKARQLAPDDERVNALLSRSEATLESMYESKIGPLSARPRVLLKSDEIIWLNLDHRAGFVLAQIDGSVTYEDLFAVSGMSRFDTARILAQLVDEGVIAADATH